MPTELQAITLQVAGSNPAGSAIHGPVAQWIERDVSSNLVVMPASLSGISGLQQEKEHRLKA